jgi:CubicO group peptidase (beta-lactamase class C family)
MNRMVTGKIGSILIITVCLSNLTFIGCSRVSQLEPEAVSGLDNDGGYTEVDNYIKQQMMAEGIPGLAVVVVRGDKIIYLKGFGITSLSDPSPVTPQTIFDLASVSKSFTALGVLLLEDDGLIDLDTPVQHYLPDFQLADPRASEITVRQLLNQTSGLPGTFSEPLIFHQGDDAMEQMVASLDHVRLNQPPGSSFEYADINYCLLGALIERVTGMTFEDYMEQKIFVPLGLSHTTLYPDEAAELGRADGHQPMFGQIIARNIFIYRSASPAGWVMSSAEDMGKWLIVHLNGGCTAEGQVIPADDIEEAHTPAVLFEENGEEIGYCMGWLSSCGSDDVSLIWHGGDTPNFTTDMILLPDYQLGVVVLVNSQASAIGHSIAPGIANLILGLELEPMAVPWWAYWKAIDTIATIALIFIFLLLLALVLYIWRIWRQFKAKQRHFLGSSLAGPMLPAWQLVLYITPLVLLTMFALAGYLVIKALYGYNFYEVLLLFQSASPPGVYISGMMLIFTVLLWAFLLAFLALFTRSSKPAA